MDQQDMDNPVHTSTPTPSTRPGHALPSSSGGPGFGGGEESDGEEEMPDYLRLAALTAKLSGNPSNEAEQNITIPKRGEKDFEPTGFGGQIKLLERSRQAMFSAISGQRRIISKALSKAVWNPEISRAVLLEMQGKVFDTIGQIERRTTEGAEKPVSRNELLPEEALFLMERGNLILLGQSGEPMALQQAFATLMNQDQLSREKYQVYAYLKRLGYVVQRAQIVDTIRQKVITQPTSADRKRNKSKAEFDAEAVLADPQRPIRLVTLLDVLLYIPKRLFQLAQVASMTVGRLTKTTIDRLRQWILRVCSRVMLARSNINNKFSGANSSSGTSRGLLGLQKWDSYDNVFHSLQIVPTGHDFFLPRPSTDDAANNNASTISSATNTTTASVTNSIRPPLPSTRSSFYASLEPFYYAWRPATLYRKSHPPPPEFRISVLNAQTHLLPSVWEFEHLFTSVPVPGTIEELVGSSLSLNEQEQRERFEYELSLKRSTEEKNKAAYGRFSQGKMKHLAEKAKQRQDRDQASQSQPSKWRRWIRLEFWLLSWISSWFNHCPPGSSLPFSSKPGFGNRRPTNWTGPKSVNPFPPLKSGRRSVVLAIIDSGTMTMLRFGEAEFEKWRLTGRDGPGRGESSRICNPNTNNDNDDHHC